MINRMIRGKIIQKYKVRDKYYHVIVDGTGLATSRNKYNENCIIKNKTDKNGKGPQEYSTYVLEAKLFVGEMVFSIGSEFVENIDGNETKQDCEIKAFKRLAKRIKDKGSVSKIENTNIRRCVVCVQTSNRHMQRKWMEIYNTI